MKTLAVILAALLTSCTADPYGRPRFEFPPQVPKDAPDGTYVTRTGIMEKQGDRVQRFDF